LPLTPLAANIQIGYPAVRLLADLVAEFYGSLRRCTVFFFFSLAANAQILVVLGR